MATAWANAAPEANQAALLFHQADYLPF